MNTYVYSANGLGNWDLKSANDRIIAFDYGHSGKANHLLIYRPGTEWLRILKNEDEHGTFSLVESGGITIDGLLDPADRLIAFDYNHTDNLDHLVLYRPGTGTIRILKHDDGAFSSVYSGPGIGGWDLK